MLQWACAGREIYLEMSALRLVLIQVRWGSSGRPLQAWLQIPKTAPPCICVSFMDDVCGIILDVALVIYIRES